MSTLLTPEQIKLKSFELRRDCLFNSHVAYVLQYSVASTVFICTQIFRREIMEEAGETRAFLSVCLSVSVSLLIQFVPPLSLSVCLSVSLPTHMSMPVYLALCLFISVCLFVCPSLSLSVCLCLSVSVCLSVSLLLSLSHPDLSLSVCCSPFSTFACLF